MQAVITLFSSLILMSTNVDAGKNQVAEALSQMDGITTLSFSKEMINAIDLDIDLEDKIKHLDGDFNEIKLNVASDDTPNLKSKKEEIIQVLNSHYKKVELKNEDEEVPEAFLYTKGKGNVIHEAHLLVLDEDDDSFTIISFQGNVTVSNKE